jgi:hypothetical protein
MKWSTAKLYLYLFVMAALIICSCSSPTAQYNKLVKRELAKGTRSDSLLLGLYMGMARKEFYDHCWKLNKQGLLTDAQGASMVQCKIKTGLKYPATMDFYPDFYKEKIFHMRASFQYDGWAPWNRSRFSDSLITDLVQLYEKWYPGNGFIKMTDDGKRTIYVKVDGNRRIILGVNSDMVVKVDYTDLLIEEKLKTEPGGKGALK